eukprot:m.56974 g.56974  ORF g.56974 m.56974 type:complete len:97 (+) comp7817_c0_seq4:144-434(+)
MDATRDGRDDEIVKLKDQVLKLRARLHHVLHSNSDDNLGTRSEQQRRASSTSSSILDESAIPQPSWTMEEEVTDEEKRNPCVNINRRQSLRLCEMK